MTARTLSERVRDLAAAHPERHAFVGVDPTGAEETLTWAQLDVRSREVADRFGDRAPDVVAIRAATSARSLVELTAALRAGCIALPVEVPVRSPGALFAAVAERTGRAVWWGDERVASPPPGGQCERQGGLAMLTGGTTGAPKVVVRPGAPRWEATRGAPLLLQKTGWMPGQTHLVAGGWYHAAPLTHLIDAILSGVTVVAPQVFAPDVVLRAMARHRVQWTQLTPSHMQLLAPALPGHRDALAHLRGVLHTAGPCARGTRETWIGAVGAERLYEMYAATEGIGVTLCRADEWQARPGTVGRGFLTRIRIYDGAEILSPGETGTVYMRMLGSGPASDAPGGLSRDGYRTVHDIGYVDEDGYLFLAGRRDDMVIVGGENVRLGAITEALMAHDDVADAATIAVEDDILGQRIVALVVAPGRRDDIRAELRLHCLARLAPREVPSQISVVATLGRNSAGKVRPDTLRELAAVAHV